MAQYYAGLDVSKDLTDISTVDEKGKIVFETSVKTDPQSIDIVLKTAGFPIQKSVFDLTSKFDPYDAWWFNIIFDAPFRCSRQNNYPNLHSDSLHVS